VNVGTICLRKGHQYLFRAFRIVKERLPEAELICVGDYKRDFRRERPKWEGAFTHYQRLTHAELAPLLRACTAFVFPSQEEGIARAQIEALASGLPLIGTHEGGATTLVENGLEGFIVRGRDPQDIAQAMMRLATDPELNRRMGEAAYRKGSVQNAWQDYGDRLPPISQVRDSCQPGGTTFVLFMGRRRGRGLRRGRDCAGNRPKGGLNRGWASMARGLRRGGERSRKQSWV
jgi:glycosyltransferase involved in cell wall biosynthesis